LQSVVAVRLVRLYSSVILIYLLRPTTRRVLGYPISYPVGYPGNELPDNGSRNDKRILMLTMVALFNFVLWHVLLIYDIYQTLPYHSVGLLLYDTQSTALIGENAINVEILTRTNAPKLFSAPHPGRSRRSPGPPSRQGTWILPPQSTFSPLDAQGISDRHLRLRFPFLWRLKSLR